jgi:hypothetical protein
VLLEKGRLAAVGLSQPIVARYLQTGQRPVAEFKHGPLKQVRVEQMGHEIVVQAEFRADHALTLPCLGFVISTISGGPVCGCNPKHNGIQAAPRPLSAGRVEARFSSPALANGTYLLSIWFGDGVEDWVNQDACLAFEVVNMVPPEHVHYAGAPIVPDCRWTFQPPSESVSREDNDAAAVSLGAV